QLTEQVAKEGHPHITRCQRPCSVRMAGSRQAIADAVEPRIPELIPAPELLRDPVDPHNHCHTNLVTECSSTANPGVQLGGRVGLVGSGTDATAAPSAEITGGGAIPRRSAIALSSCCDH